MSQSAESLNQLAAETGFRIEILEKVDRLVALLQTLFQDPYLADRLALKGGTALNLFYFGLPRLSVDIDLNYIGSVDRKSMLSERPKIEQRVRAIASRQNLTLTRAPTSHAGSKWTFRYASVLGSGGVLEIDLNYLYRQPLWPIQQRNSHVLGALRARNISVLDLHELAGGKLAALFSRTAARDLFDAHRLLTSIDTDPTRLRLAFVLYGAMNRKDWRTISPDNVNVDLNEARRQLFPLLVQQNLTRANEQKALLQKIIEETRNALGQLLPLTSNEHEFLDVMLENGSIQPHLLNLEPDFADKLISHPALQWRVHQTQR